VGATVTITGTNFGATQNGSAFTTGPNHMLITAPVTFWSDTSITITVPSGAQNGNIRVVVNGQLSNGVTFTVTPSISSLSPTSGPVGTSVTISGANFGTSQGTSSITFNGTLATPTSWSDTSIVVPVPSGATTGNVVMTVAGHASNGVSFSVQ